MKITARSSLHNHCDLCDGKDSIQEMAEAALKAGFTDFGFSSHAYAPFDLKYSVKSESDYIQQIKDLRTSFKGDMRIYVGAEIDLFSEIKQFDDYEYTIISNHYVKRGDKHYPVDSVYESLVKCRDEVFNGNATELYTEYYENMVKCASYGGDILGHFDVIKRSATGIFDVDSSEYKAVAAESLKKCIKKGMIFEINYGGMAKYGLTEPYPAPFLLEILKTENADVTISADCHDKKNIYFGYKEGEKLVRDMGFKYLTVFDSGEFVRKNLSKTANIY